MESPGAEHFRFDDFELDRTRRLLLKSGMPVALNSKTFDLLLTLIENRGEVLTKDDLLDRVWNGQFVEEGNLKVQISTLRKVFGESSNDHRFIVTVPGRGYSFVAELDDAVNGEIVVESHSLSRIVVEKTGEVGDSGVLPGSGGLEKGDRSAPLPAEVQPGRKFLDSVKGKTMVVAAVSLILVVTYAAYYYFTSAGKPIESVAVLPFVNVGADPKMDFLSDGISESLINILSRSSNLKVISRSSAFRYRPPDSQAEAALTPKMIALELGVQAVVIGRLVVRGDDLLINVELVDGRDNTHLWGEQYNRKLAEIFAVQEEIAGDISQKLRLRLSGDDRPNTARRYTDNIRAFESYVMGRSYVHRRTHEDLLIAAGHFERAIKEDQNYALAYAGLFEAYGSMGVRGYISPAETRQKVGECARKAILLDDNLAEAHAVMGALNTTFAPYDFSAGDNELRRAIEMSPSLALTHLYLSLSLLRQGRLDEGLAEMLKARELDPFSAIISKQVALYYILKRDYVRALEIQRQANETGPAFTTTTEVEIYIQNRLFDEALLELERAKHQRKDDPILLLSEGMIYAAQERHELATKAINELKRLSGTDYTHAYWIAKIYVRLGEKEHAFTWLEQGFKAGNTGSFYKDEAPWDGLRDDPRFADLLQRMGLPK